ncbi:MAG: CoA transferase, partial [Aquabacterium sp.]
ESMTEWMSYPLYYAYQGATPPPRTGSAHATIFPYGPFATGDGLAVMLGVQNEREWRAFCATVLQQPALADDARYAGNALRVAARDALRGLIEGVFASLTAAQVQQRLEAAQIANAQVNTMAEVWAHPQLVARSRWTTVDSPAGPLPALWPPALPASFDPRMDPIPALGQHTDALLAELGYSDADVQRLRRDGAV